MMESSMDWLTLTMKPETNVCEAADNYGKAIDILRNQLLLDELFTMLEYKGSARFYGIRLAYNDVNIKFAEEDKFNEQGLCIEFSSNGLRYFEEYLATYGLTLRLWCARFRALCTEGWITKCTRYDYARDDIRYDNDKPLLTMKRVLTSVCDDEWSGKARCISDNGDDLLSFKRNYKRRGGQGLWGTTVQFGERKSCTIVRFYDKLIEQKQKGKKLAENITSWVRCEFEYKADAAMVIFNAWLDLPDDSFKKYMDGRALDNLRFIYRTDENVSRCRVKRWWSEFLNGCKRPIRQTIQKPVRTSLVRAERGLRQYVRKNYTFLREYGLEGFGKIIQAMAAELQAKGKSPIDMELVNNIREGRRDFETMDGFKWYDYTTDVSSKALRGFMAQDYCVYNWQKDYINNIREDKRQYNLDKLADIERGHKVVGYGV